MVGLMALHPTPHDPLAEEMDLITWQEAAARLHDEALVVEAQIERMEAERSDATEPESSELAAARTRLGALHRVAERLSSQRPANDQDRYPNLTQE